MPGSIVWFRNDFRLADNPALEAACQAHASIVPLYIDCPQVEGQWAPGAASRAWLARSLTALDADLRSRGSRLIVRRGDPGEVLIALASESGSAAVHCNRRVEPSWSRLDAVLSSRLATAGLALHAHRGNLLVEPEAITTGQGGPYRVFTPFWRRLGTLLDTLQPAGPAPASIETPAHVDSLTIGQLGLEPRPRWDAAFWTEWQPGEAGAVQALEDFIDDAADRYPALRDRPDQPGTSRLSPHLHFGEISPRQVLRRLRDARLERQIEHAGPFLRELGWREFSQHLLWHFPEMAEHDLDPRFERFPWRPPDQALLQAWRYGRTGVPIIDAGMRELWRTGWMHNRVRMVVASFLTKHLRHHWLHGARWFWDTLLDADLASNSQGWQWCAGTGVDASPYFRVFNPVLQGERFDPHGHYVRRWVPELDAMPAPQIHAPWRHPALAARFAPGYPGSPIIDLQQGRESALLAWKSSVQGVPRLPDTR